MPECESQRKTSPRPLISRVSPGFRAQKGRHDGTGENANATVTRVTPVMARPHTCNAPEEPRRTRPGRPSPRDAKWASRPAVARSLQAWNHGTTVESASARSGCVILAGGRTNLAGNVVRSQWPCAPLFASTGLRCGFRGGRPARITMTGTEPPRAVCRPGAGGGEMVAASRLVGSPSPQASVARMPPQRPRGGASPPTTDAPSSMI